MLSKVVLRWIILFVKGVLCALGAQLLWGMSPIFFKQLVSLPVYEVASSRIVCSFVFLFFIICLLKKWYKVWRLINNLKNWVSLTVCGLLLSIVWFVFAWSVSNNKVAEAGLGYIICPLISMAIGSFLFKEKTTYLQKISILMVFIGVVYQIFVLGYFPMGFINTCY